ncbi:MAG: RagB/SusD family nutrient uptake outer membrane protein [Chitinophagaceae bacterium]|nr:RagB/SusD family nutrient uptake outer membrane protein [Chitinophagaceae bacterium]
MKLIRLKYTAFIVIVIIAMAGCKKEKLSPIPQASLSDAVAFGTPERIAQQVYGIYSACKSGQFLGGRALVYEDVRGEDWLNITGNGVTALGVWNYSVISTDNQVENMWAAGFAAINRANVVIEGIDANASVISTTLASQYKGEARFCRALCNFYIASLYGRRPYNADAGASPGLPLRLTANKSSSGAALSRSTMAETYNQILDDLNYAETNLPLRYTSGDTNVVRAHRNTAIALKTRVLLHMARYADVITEGNKLVPAAAPFAATSGVLHNLNSNFVNVFRSPYTALESIFSFPMNNNNSPGTQNGLALYHNAEFGLNSTGILGDVNWKATDVRKTLVTATQRYTKFNDDLNNWVPILRYSEVLLNLAEALARQASGVDARALAILNAIRQRSDATTTFAPATKPELIDLILNERRIELLGEGFRSLDIMRQNIPFPAKSTLAAVPPTSLAYVWPIPTTEILYNSAMVQNQ